MWVERLKIHCIWQSSALRGGNYVPLVFQCYSRINADPYFWIGTDLISTGLLDLCCFAVYDVSDMFDISGSNDKGAHGWWCCQPGRWWWHKRCSKCAVRDEWGQKSTGQHDSQAGKPEAVSQQFYTKDCTAICIAHSKGTPIVLRTIRRDADLQFLSHWLR